MTDEFLGLRWAILRRTSSALDGLKPIPRNKNCAVSRRRSASPYGGFLDSSPLVSPPLTK
jgi:hypothetical protein